MDVAFDCNSVVSGRNGMADLHDARSDYSLKGLTDVDNHSCSYIVVRDEVDSIGLASAAGESIPGRALRSL